MLPVDLSDLDDIFSEEEVWEVIKEMPSNHAPGPDGFMINFYHKTWSLIKHDVTTTLLKFYVGDGRGFSSLNKGLITLIPKKPNASAKESIKLGA